MKFVVAVVVVMTLLVSACDTIESAQFSMFVDDSGALSVDPLGCQGASTKYDAIIVRLLPVSDDGRRNDLPAVTAIEIGGGDFSVDSPVAVPGLRVDEFGAITIREDAVLNVDIYVDVPPLGGLVISPSEMLEGRNQFVTGGYARATLAELTEVAC